MNNKTQDEVDMLVKYIGVKIVKATPMTHNDASKKGWTRDGIATLDEDGYKVVYPDGYISWSPKSVFEEAYRPCNGMTFGLAIETAKKGHKIARKGWNGKNMWVVYMSGMKLPPYNSMGTERKVNDRTASLIGEDTPLETLPYLAMWTADGKWLPGWLASQTDMLAEDWEIVE